MIISVICIPSLDLGKKRHWRHQRSGAAATVASRHYHRLHGAGSTAVQPDVELAQALTWHKVALCCAKLLWCLDRVKLQLRKRESMLVLAASGVYDHIVRYEI